MGTIKMSTSICAEIAHKRLTENPLPEIPADFQEALRTGWQFHVSHREGRSLSAVGEKGSTYVVVGFPTYVIALIGQVIDDYRD
jgi:hypothetical protein